MVLHPDEAHDGHATVDAGFAYRMLYVDPAAVSAAIGGNPPFVPEVVADDPVLAGLLREAFADFPQTLEPLAVDAVVERLAGRLAALSDDRPRARGTTGPHRAGARPPAFSGGPGRSAGGPGKSSRRCPASTAPPFPATSAPPPAPR